MGDIFGVIGAGTMGNGIAQVAARAGFQVVMRDIADDFLARGLKTIDKSLQRDVDKERLTADEKQAFDSGKPPQNSARPADIPEAADNARQAFRRSTNDHFAQRRRTSGNNTSALHIDQPMWRLGIAAY